MKLLLINASTRKEQSRTLSISMEFLKSLNEKHPEVQVDEFDLANTELPPVLDINVQLRNHGTKSLLFQSILFPTIYF